MAHCHNPGWMPCAVDTDPYYMSASDEAAYIASRLAQDAADRAQAEFDRIADEEDAALCASLDAEAYAEMCDMLDDAEYAANQGTDR